MSVKPAPKPADHIAAWMDDPMSVPETAPRSAAVPDLNAAKLKIRITTTTIPEPRTYPTGTPKFRYWCAAEALSRAAAFWSAQLPDISSWQPGNPLSVRLDAGVDLNAYYDRNGLDFFHDKVDSTTVYSGESPDVLCHELGHAVLDAVKPQLWDAASDEVAAFHESFGDMSSILCALQLPEMRAAVLGDTSGHLYQNSRLSRLAEQLGWAIRSRYPDAADPDCLRNAVNKFVYTSPLKLPHDGPNWVLSSEAHSFSRVFTAAFFEALAGMFAVGGAGDSDALLQVSQAAAELLVYAVTTAPVRPEFYSQVAIHMVEGAAGRFDGKYVATIKSAFVKRGILSSEAATVPVEDLAAPSRITGMVAGAATAVLERRQTVVLPLVSIPAQSYGLAAAQLFVRLAGDAPKYRAAAASPNVGVAATVTAEEAAQSFVEDLFRRGEVAVGEAGNKMVRAMHPHTTKTHQIKRVDGALVLERLCTSW